MSDNLAGPCSFGANVDSQHNGVDGLLVSNDTVEGLSEDNPPHF